jgi:trans-2,3-dihydro-3-hydroxyanthranilate isomerase
VSHRFHTCDVFTVQRARANLATCEALLEMGIRPSIHLYERTAGPDAIHARMFASLSGVPEDPATGSAACAIAGLLAHASGEASADFAFKISQGLEMGRPSRLDARARKRDGTVVSTGVGGSCVFVSEGLIEVE